MWGHEYGLVSDGETDAQAVSFIKSRRNIWDGTIYPPMYGIRGSACGPEQEPAGDQDCIMAQWPNGSMDQ